MILSLILPKNQLLLNTIMIIFLEYNIFISVFQIEMDISSLNIWIHFIANDFYLVICCVDQFDKI